MKYVIFIGSLPGSVILPFFCMTQQKPIWKNQAFAIYSDSIVQGNFVAKALSSTEISSNYQSPANEFQSPAITFKFSINGKDNEMKSGTDHHFNCTAADGKMYNTRDKIWKNLMTQIRFLAIYYLSPNTQFNLICGRERLR
jgi:hypothetical protein